MTTGIFQSGTIAPASTGTAIPAFASQSEGRVEIYIKNIGTSSIYLFEQPVGDAAPTAANVILWGEKLQPEDTAVCNCSADVCLYLAAEFSTGSAYVQERSGGGS